MTPALNKINNNTSPITDAGIGNGINDSIIFETNNTATIVNTWIKKL